MLASAALLFWLKNKGNLASHDYYLLFLNEKQLEYDFWTKSKLIYNNVLLTFKINDTIFILIQFERGLFLFYLKNDKLVLKTFEPAYAH